MSINVTIITVCFNSEKTIAQTIESVVNQSYSNIEYILIDGKSTDDTLKIIAPYEKVFNGRMKYISEPDTGIYNAMNKGISMATGELIGIINSDDWYETDAVSLVVNAYRQYGPGVYYGIQRIIEGDREWRTTRNHHNYLHEAMIPHPTCFVPKGIYSQIGSFDEGLRTCADYEFMLRAKEKGICFVPIDAIMANFRLGGASDSLKATFEVLDLQRRKGVLSSKQYYINKSKAVIKRAFLK